MKKNIVRKINTARMMSPRVLIVTLMGLGKQNLRRCLIKFHPVKLSDKKILKATGCKNINEFLDKEVPPFFFNPNEKEKMVETIKKEYPESIEQTINDVDEICNHIFDLLGSGKTELGKEIDWHLDFKCGFRWDPKTYYLGTGKHVTLDDPSDVKVPWELWQYL